AALPALGHALQADARAHADRWGKSEVGALIWDHRTGYVEALVGGRSWDPEVKEIGRFDRILQSCRQPGSAWKPVLYGAALDAAAITPGTPLRDAPIAEYNEVTNVHWKPRSGNRFRGVVLAQDALAASLNAPAIDVLDRVGGAAVIAFARRLGISAEIADVGPMALGASCVKPIELARAYAVIARRGWAVAPRFAVRVRRGEIVLFDAAVPEDPWLDPARRFDRLAATAGQDPDERQGAEGGRLVDERIAFQLQDMMAAVVTRGTASAARELGRPAAGKTGTTNDNTDAWFIGFTGRALAAVWLGFDAPTRKLGHDGDGAHAALPLWMRAIRIAEGARPRVAVPGAPPAGLERVTVDRESGLISARGAGGLALWFRAGTAPTEVSGQPGTSPTDFGRSAREF
ncbi:MAG: penicillin-binding transpeptidase domain-containing protein, partial [Myxococcota bacterium]|nr:penicillin-binding transpeptidase domain-containing protein [Myxococcota bacterium]